MSSEESRLGRWARRKAEVRRARGGATPEPLREPAEPAVPAEAAKPDVPDTLPEGLDLPDIESLTAESDFSVFMKEGVPPALRRLALQKLWSSDPMFNVIDEMVEYGEDYNKLATFADGVASAWQPGRGYAKDEEENSEDADAAQTEAVPAEAEAWQETQERKVADTGEDAGDEDDRGEDPELG